MRTHMWRLGDGIKKRADTICDMRTFVNSSIQSQADRMLASLLIFSAEEKHINQLAQR